MKIKIQFANEKIMILEDALIDGVRRLRVISSDYEKTLDMYASSLGYFMYLERPGECEYPDDKSDSVIIEYTKNKRIRLFHPTGYNAMIQHGIKHLWLKKFLFWRQIF